MNILVTGGAGYIGSHTVLELLSAEHTISVIDNLSNSSHESLKRVETLTNHKINFFNFDVRDDVKLDDIFSNGSYEAVIHFAGLKSVGESVRQPLKYYQNNIDSTLVLLDKMKKYKVKKIIFSSSATVYGTPTNLPLTEADSIGVGITNPYGQTKFMLEQILNDINAADKDIEVTLLRYFNPVGAHPSGIIGEDPADIPNNLLPYISQVAIGKLDSLNIYGNDYDTIDGTGVRDYIHVVDLARGHVAALNHSKPGVQTYNLGTGKGVSVLELVKAFAKASGKIIPYKFVDRRPGDVASCYASVDKANKELDWIAEKSIDESCVDSWRWQLNNPNGYR